MKINVKYSFAARVLYFLFTFYFSINTHIRVHDRIISFWFAQHDGIQSNARTAYVTLDRTLLREKRQYYFAFM